MKYPSDAVLETLERLSLQLVWQFRLDLQRAFEPLGVSPMQAFALVSLREGIDQPSSLGFVMDVSPSGVSQLLAGLEERGWVRRELDRKDRRQVRVLLTEEGLGFLERLRKSWREISRERYSRLNSREIAMLCESYQKLLAPRAVGE
ncbi:MarR family winged helix-turn-helix transcriptional regulator [Calidithermus timidus]|uniref:MarR family winged helix-turn-helix transcriptional regulator n=1 Tax=Calidithermus timidus TaxID=307124 RepID=UPI001FE113B3|nr:winged helix DNA-binding protein [Calidithermus timidus]